MAIRLVLNNKPIWDNTDFENILFSDLLDQTDSYLPVRQINNEVVTVGFCLDRKYRSALFAGHGWRNRRWRQRIFIPRYRQSMLLTHGVLKY